LRALRTKLFYLGLISLRFSLFFCTENVL